MNSNLVDILIFIQQHCLNQGKMEKKFKLWEKIEIFITI